jgi:hypothetical protein
MIKSYHHVRRNSDALYNHDELLEATGNKIFLFIHYSPFGRIPQSFFRLIKSAQSQQGMVIITSPYICKMHLERLRDLKVVIYIRKNEGYDFGALIDTYFVLRRNRVLSRFCRLIVINNSMVQVGESCFKSDKGLKSLVESSLDLYGITESYQLGHYHVQSYHISMSREFILSRSFLDFAMTYDLSIRDRQYAVEMGEIRLSQFALAGDFSVGAFLSFSDIARPESFVTMNHMASEISQRIGNSNVYNIIVEQLQQEWMPSANRDSNLSHSCWALLIAKGYYFVKRELLDSNPTSTTSNAMIRLVLDVLDVEGGELDDIQYISRPSPQPLKYSLELPFAGPPPIL